LFGGRALPADDQTFRAVWLISLLLMVLAGSLPLLRSQRQWLRQAAVWVLALGFLFAGYRIVEWLIGR
jgi:hypothetical protein